MKRGLSRVAIAVSAVALLLVAATPAHAEWNKGLEAYKNKDWATAVKEFQEVTETNPDYAGGYYMLGVSQRSLGQLSPALASLCPSILQRTCMLCTHEIPRQQPLSEAAACDPDSS